MLVKTQCLVVMALVLATDLESKPSVLELLKHVLTDVGPELESQLTLVVVLVKVKVLGSHLAKQ